MCSPQTGDADLFKASRAPPPPPQTPLEEGARQTLPLAIRLCYTPPAFTETD